jgi:hypothetical protein
MNFNLGTDPSSSAATTSCVFQPCSPSCSLLQLSTSTSLQSSASFVQFSTNHFRVTELSSQSSTRNEKGRSSYARNTTGKERIQTKLPEVKKTMFQRAQPIHVPEPQQNQPIKYSLSSDVSSVKFSSNGLNYNF